MAKLAKNVKNLQDKFSLSAKAKRAVVGDKKYDQAYGTAHFLGTSAIKARDAAKAAEASVQAAGNERAIPLPDEEELARIRRRRALGGGRASTQLTGETFGP